ncbi:hypothetical protein [Aestuariivirga sp.]|uniref:hypothetical protein n=1 Tax=Aestuariivirga sp. TaxID=2650926 RepID=UPI0039199411
MAAAIFGERAASQISGMKSGMMNIDLRAFGKTASAVLLGMALAAAPALAEKGGNGKGGNGGTGGGGGGGSSNSQSSNGGGAKSQSAKSAKATKTTKATKSEDGSGDASASSFGNINGFLHASPNALANASANSLIGRVTMVYGAQLRSYLNGTPDDTEPTLEDLQNTLDEIANKDVTPEMIAAINQKLVENDPELAGYLETSGKTLEDLNIEVETGTPLAPELTTGEDTTGEQEGETEGTL